ncbi:recombinase family protein [Streptomyces sioyaensis]|uniref:recombinase family protein n=1 Tax=Streptomyces sioyaensis TaxID=67364 RepID=UPI0033F9A0DD
MAQVPTGCQYVPRRARSSPSVRSRARGPGTGPARDFNPCPESTHRQPPFTVPHLSPLGDAYEIGYGRVSLLDQNPDSQHDKLTAAGCTEGQIYVDKATGKHANRPELHTALQVPRAGGRDSGDRGGQPHRRSRTRRAALECRIGQPGSGIDRHDVRPAPAGACAQLAEVRADVGTVRRDGIDLVAFACLQVLGE